MGFTSDRIGAQQRTSMEQFLIDRHYAGSGAGVPVTNHAVAGIPAFDAAVAFAANAVAQLSMRVWRGEGPIRIPVSSTWQARLFRGAACPTQDWFTFWYTIEASRTARRNAYIWKTKDASGRVVALTALHPDQVFPFRYAQSRGIRFAVTFSQMHPIPPDVDGYGAVTVDSSVLHHIRGRGGIGEVIAPSPIQELRSSLGLAIAKREYESALYRNGVQGGLAIAFPGGVNKEQGDKFREAFDSEHAGPLNSGKTKVVGGGATITKIGMSQVDAQFVESARLSTMDMALITGVPEWLIGGSTGDSKPISPEHEMQRWMYTALAPRLSAIESSLNADPDLFGSGADYAAFDTADVIRGDLTTEADIAIRKVQAGIWLPDEARSRDSLPGLAGGVGQIVQITPVGGTPNAPAPSVGGTNG